MTTNDAEGFTDYNYRTVTEKDPNFKGEQPGASAFLLFDGKVYHTYSTYARGLDILMNTYNWLDLTALGRQEDQELPKGRSTGPFMAWIKRHDEYSQTNGKTNGCCQ